MKYLRAGALNKGGGSEMDSLFSVEGKVAIVTGSTQGLGRMIASGLVAAGAKVYITSRDTEACNAAASEIGAIALPGDAGSPDGIVDLVSRFREAGEDRLEILVNNAGRTWGAPFEEFPDKAWPGVMAVNVQAPFRMVQELLSELERAGASGDPARVINIGSIAGAITTDLNAYSYTASKAALHMLTRQLANDLIARNINVNVVLPGYFPSKLTAHITDNPDADESKLAPMGRMGRPDDIAGVIVFLSSRAGAYVTGVELPVDGGLVGLR
jgi:NAD(P)-dependent dehydrogenase (short-subunit alcohol dehydrogenase family)